MFNRFCFGALLFAGIAVSITGCNTSGGFASILVAPSTASLTVGGPTAQLTVTGTFGNGSHPTTKAVTSGLTWTSSSVGVAAVDSSGVVTPVSAGSATITASAQGFAGTVTSTANVTVTGGSSTGTGTGTQTVSSIAIIPSTQIVASPPQTTQFIAIGTTSSDATLDLTNSVTWSSSSSQIATITSGGLATAVGQGTTTITALYTNASTGTVAKGTATFTVTAGTAETITAVTILPTSAALTETQTAQLMAIGTNGTTGLDNIITSDSKLKWYSSLPSVATVCNLGDAAPCTTATVGQVVGVSPGTTTVTALYTNTDTTVVTAGSAASVTVSTSAAPEPLLSIKIIPGDTTVTNKGMTGQYLAFGTFSTAPTMQDITNGISHVGFAGCTATPCTTTTPVTWISFAPDVASISSSGTTGENGGLATAMGYEGDSVIYAEALNPDGTAVLSNAQTFSCKLSPPTPAICDSTPAVPETFSTLTVFNVGENTTTWQVTAPSDTGVANLIHCGPVFASGSTGSVCTGTYAVGSKVTLTASPTGSSFGGWSAANCGTPITTTTTTTDPDTGKTTTTTTITGYTPNMTSTCTVTLQSSMSVGAIFY
jgi:hypothetical protein